MDCSPKHDAWKIVLVLFLGFLAACGETEQGEPKSLEKLFSTIPSEYSGINFQNRIEETESSNYYQYMYSYIGGGVAAADFNGDGLEDLFFVSNSFENKLYLNQGDLKFVDITEKAGIEKREGFDAGVTIVDINADGLLDIYLSRGGGNPAGKRFANMLYVNQGVVPSESGTNEVRFREMAQSYGLADTNRSIQATFFDYDKDGDLDCYVANTPDFEDRAADILDLQVVQSDPNTLVQRGSDKLYQNDGAGKFIDVSLSAGILPDLGFGLNPQVGDLNEDGWLDIYVCNDFRIPDFAYINQGDGTFREGRAEILKHLSFNSMGGDMGDINNDGYLDLYTLDMNPEDYVRSKTTMGMTPVERFEEMVDKGYHYNYMHNMLQVNNANGTFSEIANMSGVANTDWSWACLLADFDLDGYNDIYVTNGVFRDVIDRDANTAILAKLRENGRKPTPADFLEFTRMLPQQKLNNYFFRNKGDLSFENVSTSWTDPALSFSNGALYADLDNDGDLEVVVNNINSEALILKNNAIESQKGNFLQLDIKGPQSNPNGIGTLVKAYLEDGQILTRQLIPTRGFLSSVSTRLHLGLATQQPVPRLEVIWPDGKRQELAQVSPNQILPIDYAQAMAPGKDGATERVTPLFAKQNFPFSHTDPPFNDYSKQILLPHKLSQTGPAGAVGDVNGDGLEDVFVGGGHSQAGTLLLRNNKGDFTKKSTPSFERDRQREDVAACFFDSDQDGDLDLYVASGSYEFALNSKLLQDRLYINDGQGNFTRTNDKLPAFGTAASVVKAADYDRDGDLDLFVGSRVVPGGYPFPPDSYLLVNDGGSFKIGNETFSPELTQVGMVTDAVWEDLEGDGDIDLIVAGEWTGIEVFVNESGVLAKDERYTEIGEAKGWWNRIKVVDVDEDGDMDIIAGNQGLNYKIHASTEKPFHVYTHDFDFNGTVDVFLAKNYKGKEVPVRGKTCSSQQLPHLANKIQSFNDFASRDIAGILGPSINSALHYTVVEFRSGIFLNEGGSFQFSPFPLQAQQSLVNSIIYQDLDKDGIKDLLLAGNNYMSEIETTRSDAGIGVFLKGKGKGEFEPVSHTQSGFFAAKDVRNMIYLDHADNPSVLVLNNNDQHDLYSLNPTNVN